VVTLGGEGSCFASLTYYPLASLPSTNCAITIYDDEEEEGFGHLQNMEENPTENAEEEDASHGLATDDKVTLASINGVPKFNTFRMRGVLQGQKVSILIDGGASHNFIDSSLLQRRHIPTVEFEGFRVELVGGAHYAL
jgi:hypothetical protein